MILGIAIGGNLLSWCCLEDGEVYASDTFQFDTCDELIDFLRRQFEYDYIEAVGIVEQDKSEHSSFNCGVICGYTAARPVFILSSEDIWGIISSKIYKYQIAAIRAAKLARERLIEARE